MYLVAQPYRCQKCGFEGEWSPHSKFGKTPTSISYVETGKGSWSEDSWENPVCPKCWRAFILDNFGIMVPFTPPDDEKQKYSAYRKF